MTIILESSATNRVTTEATTHPISVASGSGTDSLYLLAFGSGPDTTTTTTPAGWSVCNGTVDGTGSTDYKDLPTSQSKNCLFYRYSDTALSTFDVTTDVAERSSHLMMRFSGTDGVTAPVFSLVTTNSGGTTSEDAPSLTHGLGSTGVMGLCLLQHYRENRTIVTAPLTDNELLSDAVFGAPRSTICTQIFDADTIDPGTYTMSASIANHTIATIALAPAGGGGGSNVVPIIVVQQQT